MKIVLAIAIAAAINFSSYAESRVTYVGSGRYSCSGNNTQCAQIEQNNRQQQQLEQSRYQQEQERAQAIVNRERRFEEEQQRAQRRTP